ncbi:MAG: radical SAM protein [Theionarchaea archaeon]|nr:radical SAM protein [Theionarchaea archaeon]MBU7000572.1 radical SAM protein [Theionarchaea archaeon]MBU7020474.1 radical SAM protein [Theionarchaea archaeon]
MVRFLLLNSHKWEPPSPPAALDYVAEQLEHEGVTTDLVDVAFTTEDDLKALLQATHYDGVCMTIRNLERTAFSEVLHFSLPATKSLFNLVKAYCQGPVVVGGNGFSILPEKILEYVGADYGIYGGGEASLPLLIRHILYGTGKKSEIPYLVYREGDMVRCNPPALFRKELPVVHRGYVDYHMYYNPGHQNFCGFGVVETKRGCPYNCIYCVEPFIKGNRVRVKPPSSVAAEIDWFLRERITYLFVADSEFNVDCEAAVRLVSYLKEHGYHQKIKWIAYVSPTNFTEELAALFSQSGVLSLMIDFAHVNPTMLSNLGKTHTPQDIEQAMALCREYSIPFRGSLMLGGPGETYGTIEEAIEFFKGWPCKVFMILGIRVFPNTPLGKMVQKGNIPENPNLYGKVVQNDDLLEPVYYISHHLGEDVFGYCETLIGDSKQFYTVTSPFKLTKTMHGPFKGVRPEYELSGFPRTQYITRLPEGTVEPPIFEEEEDEAANQ